MNIQLKTTMGDITLKLFEDVAPKACENFSTLCENGYYNDISFHRVIKGFMVQGGDPTGTGAGGESIWDEDFEDECTPDKTFSKEGMLAMANSGPGTNGSQFFITLAPATWLDGNHTIFGEVADGMETLEAIGKCKTDSSDRPKEDISIISGTIEREDD